MEVKENFAGNEFELVVDDGTRRIPIKNTMGDEVGVFYFRPTDIGILKRYREVSETFAEVVKPLESVNITSDGTSTDDDGNEALEKAKGLLYEKIDYLFDSKCSEAFFGSMNPFSPVNGNFYCENVLNAVAGFISKQFDTEVKKINKRVGKYTDQYRKK